jgi:hypothetical protein
MGQRFLVVEHRAEIAHIKSAAARFTIEKWSVYVNSPAPA